MYDDELSVGQWLGTLFLLCIPVVGLILLFIWAFGSNTQIDKKRYAQAQLIFAAIGLVLGIIFTVIFGAALVTMFSAIGG